MFANHGVGDLRGIPAGILQRPAFLGRVLFLCIFSGPLTSARA